jgi:hypothetical protein
MCAHAIRKKVSSCRFAIKNHARMIENAITEIAIRSEARVIDIFNVIA